MQKYIKLKQLIILTSLLLPTIWCGAFDTHFEDGYSHISIKEGNVQNTPRGSTIQAYIDGHFLTVTFTQDIGTVTIELDKVSGPVILSYQVQTPDCYQYYLPLTGDYIITFTLANGDEYYGEFSVTN